MAKKTGSDSAMQSSSKHNSSRYKRQSLTAETWNVRTLVESTGDDCQICWSRPQLCVSHNANHSDMGAWQHVVDRKLDILV